MKKYMFALCLITSVLSISCRKKEITSGPVEKTEITFGSMDGMKKIPHSGDSVCFDGDAKSQIKLITEQIKIKGPIFIWKLSLRAMNDGISFMGTFRNDTTFMYRDTTMYTDNYTYKVYSRTETCERKYATDSVVSIHPNHFSLSYHPIGTKAGVNNPFGNDENVLFDEDRSYTDLKTISPDTVEVHSKVYLKNCDNIRPEGTCFIGFKFRKGSKTRLGWIKIKANGRTHVIEEVVMAE